MGICKSKRIQEIGDKVADSSLVGPAGAETSKFKRIQEIGDEDVVVL